MSRNITIVAEETSPTPQLPLAELYTHFKPADRPAADPGQYLDLIMELIAQDLLNARYQGKPFDEKSLERLLRYENQRLRREALRLRQQKAKSVNPPPPANVVALEVKRFTVPTTEPQASAEPAMTESAPTEPVAETLAERAVATATEVAADASSQPLTPEDEAELAAKNARIKELEAERDRLGEVYKWMYGHYPPKKSKVIPNPS